MTLEEVFQKETGEDKDSNKTFRDKFEYHKKYNEWLEVVIKQLRDSIDKPWKPFYFEGNQAWGWIDTPEEWERIKKAYEDTDMDLASARRNPNNEKDAFGFYHEYNGNERLGDFAKTNNMDLSVP